MATDLERAILYAEQNEKGVEVSPRLAVDEKAQHYWSLIRAIPTTERLLALQLKLEEDLPYFRAVGDEAIRTYFLRWNIPIDGGADLDNFAAVLGERVQQLATTDVKAQQYLQQQDYRLKLRDLPAAVSRLEKTLDNFDALREPVETMAVIFYNTMMKQEFSMHFLVKGCRVSVKYVGVGGDVIDRRTYPCLAVSRKAGNPGGEEFIVVPYYGREISWSEKLRRKFQGIKIERQTEPVRFLISRDRGHRMSVDLYLNELKYKVKTGSINIYFLNDFLDILLHLPKHIHDYLTETDASVHALFHPRSHDVSDQGDISGELQDNS